MTINRRAHGERLLFFASLAPESGGQRTTQYRGYIKPICAPRDDRTILMKNWLDEPRIVKAIAAPYQVTSTSACFTLQNILYSAK
jgi:hypothetical protein